MTSTAEELRHYDLPDGLAAGRKGRERAEPERVRPHPGAWHPPVDGFYENAFHLIRQAYSEAHQKNLMPTSPFTDARKAFSPMNYTPMMEQVGKDWKLWNLNWLPSDEFPGEESRFKNCEQPPTPLGFVKLILNRATAFLDEKRDKHPILVSSMRMQRGISAAQLCTPVLPAEAEPEGKHTALHCITAFTHTLSEDVALHTREVHLQLAEWIREFNAMLFRLVVHLIEGDDELRRFFYHHGTPDLRPSRG